MVGITNSADVFVTALDPYGFGVSAEAELKPDSRDFRGDHGLAVKLRVQARRADSVNLGRPWEVSLIAGDMARGIFAVYRMKVSVLEKTGEEGRVLFILTQDHEQTSALRESGPPPAAPRVTAGEARRELVEKMALANELAGKHGVRWSHIVDIGSAVLRLKWAQTPDFSAGWRDVWPAMRQTLIQSCLQGHDVQLHIHGYNIPGNKLSRQFYDPESKSIRFAGNLTRAQGAGETHGSWADNFTRFGSFDEDDSKVGSLFMGVRLLEGEFHEACPSHRILFFRAGEYEFGADGASIASSIQSLRQNQILAGSDSHSGSPYRRDFKFFKPVGRNVYFTSSASIAQPASSLLDIGILEFLPVPEQNGHDHLSPMSSLRSIRENYQRCLAGDAVRSGLFVIMEMYHLNSANRGRERDIADPGFGDWKKMETQFANIKTACPKIECVTVSEAVKIYLDRYAPDIVALRTNERKVSPNEYHYDIQLLGKDVEVSVLRPHYVAVKPPSYFVGRIARVEVRWGDKVVSCWENVQDYRDLPFTIQGRSGYSLHVWLKGS